MILVSPREKYAEYPIRTCPTSCMYKIYIAALENEVTCFPMNNWYASEEQVRKYGRLEQLDLEVFSPTSYKKDYVFYVALLEVT